MAGVLFFLGFLTLVAVGIFLQWKRPQWKGQFAEKLAYRKMLELPDEYTIFNDVLFESNGRSTQIDHIVVSPYGVFVIETKGYKGWIMGGENSEYWTQVIYKSKHQFYNPIKQNEGHVRFLRYLLRSSVEIPIIPIVVFNDSAELKVYVHNHIVTNRCYLTEAIEQYQTPVLSAEIIAWIVRTIHAHSSTADKEARKRHKENVQEQQGRSEWLQEQGVCPKCGGTLVLRHGRYGDFVGCFNYPNCRFSTNA